MYLLCILAMQHNQLSREMPDSNSEYRVYDIYGRLYYSKDFKGQITKFEYDAKGQLEYKRYYGNQARYDANDPNETVQYVYDRLGRKRQVINSNGTTEYTYDAANELNQVTSPEGTVYYYYYPTSGRILYTYTDSGNTMEYSYDGLGRLKNAAEYTAWTNANYEYSDVGSRSKVNLSNGNSTIYNYDKCNRLINLSHNDSASRLLSSYNYTIGADGRRDGVSEELRQPGLPASNPVTETHNIIYSYDNLNRLTGEQAQDGTGKGYSIEYKHDVIGNRLERKLTVNTTQKVKTTYTYNVQNDRLESEQNTTFSMLIPGYYDRAGFLET